jgi:hypothetical protein
MRRVLLLALLGWLWPCLLHAQCVGMPPSPIPFATEILTITQTVTVLTQAVYRPSGAAAAMAVVTLEDGDIRYQVVGTPTPTDGHLVRSGGSGTSFSICGLDSIQAFKAIRVATTDVRATVTYYRAK